jgi:hypothetical protein
MFSFFFGDNISKFINKDDIDEYGDYSLNYKNSQKFLLECDDEIRPVIKKIIEKTKYVSFMDFMRSLFSSVKKLFDKINELNKKTLYLYDCKCNRWLFKYIYKMINFLNPEIKFRIINDKYKNFKDDDFIILPFDCLFDGNQINLNVNIISKFKKAIHIYILSPYMSSYAIFNIINKYNEKKFNYKMIIGSHKKIDEFLLKDVLNFKEIVLLEKYYPSFQNNQSKFNTNYNNVYLFYFNHKLGDFNTTLTLLYMGIIPNMHNSIILKNEKDIHKLQIIPLINNCNYVYNYDNIDSKFPICPSPKYI